MSDDVHAPAPAALNGGASAAPAPAPKPTDRPEVLVGGAFVGGMVAALILRRLGRD